MNVLSIWYINHFNDVFQSDYFCQPWNIKVLGNLLKFWILKNQTNLGQNVKICSESYLNFYIWFLRLDFFFLKRSLNGEVSPISPHHILIGAMRKWKTVQCCQLSDLDMTFALLFENIHFLISWKFSTKQTET